MTTAEEPAKVRVQIEALQTQIAQLEEKHWIVSPEAIANDHKFADFLFISEGMYVVMDE